MEKPTAKVAMLRFIELAKSRGYTEKVVGDDAYTKSRTPQSPMIRLLGARGGKLQIFERPYRLPSTSSKASQKSLLYEVEIKPAEEGTGP